MSNIHFFTEVDLPAQLYAGQVRGKPKVCRVLPLKSMEITAKYDGQCSKKATNIVIFNK